MDAREGGLARTHGRQLVFFGGVGLLSTATDLVLFAGLVGAGLAPVLANLCSFLVANVQGYVLNGTLTFREGGARRRLSLGGYARFLSGYLFSLVVSTAIIWRLADPISPVGAKLVAIVATGLVNYLFTAFFVFRRSQSE